MGQPSEKRHYRKIQILEEKNVQQAVYHLLNMLEKIGWEVKTLCHECDKCRQCVCHNTELLIDGGECGASQVETVSPIE